MTKTGFRSWRWKFRYAGKEKRLVLGSYRDMSLSAARDARDNAARLLKSGIDPSLQSKQLAAMRLEEVETIFEAVAREWHAQQMGGWVPRHAADVIKSLEQDVFPKIGALPIKGITSPMVLEVIRAIEARPSIETARCVRQRIQFYPHCCSQHALAQSGKRKQPGRELRHRMRGRCFHHAQEGTGFLQCREGGLPSLDRRLERRPDGRCGIGISCGHEAARPEAASAHVRSADFFSPGKSEWT